MVDAHIDSQFGDTFSVGVDAHIDPQLEETFPVGVDAHIDPRFEETFPVSRPGRVPPVSAEGLCLQTPNGWYSEVLVPFGAGFLLYRLATDCIGLGFAFASRTKTFLTPEKGFEKYCSSRSAGNYRKDASLLAKTR